MPTETATELSFGQHSVAPKSVGHKPTGKKYRDAEEAPLPLSSDPRVGCAQRGLKHAYAFT